MTSSVVQEAAIGGAPGRCLGFYAVGYIEVIWKRVRIGQLSAYRPSLLLHHIPQQIYMRLQRSRESFDRDDVL